MLARQSDPQNPRFFQDSGTIAELLITQIIMQAKYDLDKSYIQILDMVEPLYNLEITKKDALMLLKFENNLMGMYGIKPLLTLPRALFKSYMKDERNIPFLEFIEIQFCRVAIKIKPQNELELKSQNSSPSFGCSRR
jgi:hypothetical protein